ncbi:hypothetical protein N7468_007682 [Penicillium chermesinum]|uniref:SWR1-complex protein 5 n=1 Tax=Penicillium chermesinum TaxID=63820 RepID=A0A9W9TKQ2_9EURO|nr:uncharacterized protein N7468_007682 [Penicillium chermesinum]KAJ5226457.1 hypothetical protein N7468_007682 [Penicillium chermesinum]KAJ6160361.1 hypothetical protein N7470_003757 [Penicillium chermesinum]
MSVDPVIAAAELEDEPYDSAEDEDFQLEAVQDDSDLSSDSDAEPAKKKRKTDKKSDAPAEDLDSGDEVTIKKAQEKREKRRKRNARGKNARDDDLDLSDDDEGGTGGFVRTRAMREKIQEERERRPLARIDGATVDVDELWAQMNTPGNELGLRPSQIKHDNEPTPEVDHTADSNTQDQRAPEPENNPRHIHTPQMIKIKRTYKFAGEMITEEKVVPKDSAEAKAFLSSGENVEYAEVEDAAANVAPNLRRPLRKISRFDPNPTGLIKKNWEKQSVEAGGDKATGPKINTVEKSRLDWAQYVDQAGIKDELRVHSKAKEGYINRMDFLGRMEAKRDEEARQARLKGM